MLPLSGLDRAEAQQLLGVLFDLDDTLLDHSVLTQHAYDALWRLHAAGLKLLVVTGRPSGWADVLVRLWPIDGMVAENGIVTLLKAEGRYRLLDEVALPAREARRRRLDELVAEIRDRFDFITPATDVHLRRADFTFDIGETCHLEPLQVDEVERFAKMRGARTVRSSVHLHLCFDGSDKGSGAVRALVAGFGLDATTARNRFAFIGDSENDEAAFSTFRTTVGVRNLRGRPTVPPRYRTENARGAGFAEFAARLVALRDTPR